MYEFESWCHFLMGQLIEKHSSRKNRSDSDNYSLVNYMGDAKLGVPSMSATINLMKDNLDLKFMYI